MQYLSAKANISFKKLFGNKHRKNLTINFLNSILERKSGELITDVTFRDTANLPETIDKKKTFVDIYCTDEQGNHYIIEMQVSFQKFFLERSQYYASFALSQQLNIGANYDKLVPVIFIAILDHELFLTSDAISHHFITNSKTGNVALKHLNFHFIELPKFNKNINQLKTDVDAWIFFIKNAENYHTIPQELQNKKELVEAFHTLEKAQWTSSELEAYITEMDELGRDERIKQGALEQGFKKGLEAGIKKGEQKKSEAIIINLLQNNIDMHIISLSTGYSIEDIDRIKQQLKNRS